MGVTFPLLPWCHRRQPSSTAPGHVISTGYSSWATKTGASRALQRGHLAFGCREAWKSCSPWSCICLCLAWSTGTICLFHWINHPYAWVFQRQVPVRVSWPLWRAGRREHLLPMAAGCQGGFQSPDVLLGMGWRLEVSVWVLLSPLCALGRAQPPVTDVLVWVRFPLCARRVTQGLGFFRGSECFKLPSDFPCNCWKSAFLKFHFSVDGFFPLSTRV